MQDSFDNTAGVVPQLISAEARVLGALMEKQLTTPDQYPLTLNSLMSACNQKSSREPVTNYTQGDIARTLIELEHRKFVRKEFGSRAEKYSQHFISHLALTKKHQALLCVMMLRGPQTLSELNTRTQRMVEFSDKNELQHTLDRLCDREVPFAVRLSQQPGQRGERFAHLFSGEPATANSSSTVTTPNSVANAAANPATNQAANQAASQTPSPATSALANSAQTSAAPTSSDNSTLTVQLQDEVNRLKNEVENLQAQTTQLKQQLLTLYKLTGKNLPT